MEDALIQILSTLKYPVIRQGSLAPNQPYPETFFTYWCNYENEKSAYDNETVLMNCNYDVNCYSTSPKTVYTVLSQARKLLKQNGWIIERMGYDLSSDEYTHTGRGCEVSFLSYENNTEVNENV